MSLLRSRNPVPCADTPSDAEVFHVMRSPTPGPHPGLNPSCAPLSAPQDLFNHFVETLQSSCDMVQLGAGGTDYRRLAHGAQVRCLDLDNLVHMRFSANLVQLHFGAFHICFGLACFCPSPGLQMARVDGTSCRLIASRLRCQAQSEYFCQGDRP